ncbi:MAG: YicC family protein [Candidatus Eisenbacteria bacterium]|nr:YicC family protein [Candidatus Eisenbacteria bacterium]
MPVSSMTGYGLWETRVSGLSVSVEIRSVNHRYLEPSIRLPGPLLSSEQRVRELLQARLDRGRVSLTVELNSRDGMETLEPDEARIRAYLDLARRLKKKYNVPGEADLDTILRLPDVMVRRTREIREKELWPLVEKGIGRALDNMIRMRRREGRTLEKDLRARIRAIRAALQRVERRSTGRPGRAAADLRARIEKILEGTAVSEERMANEAAFLADRLDTTEEIVRARSHLDQFLVFMSEGGPVGRKLNFLLQELHREINTVGSKVNDAEIAREVVGLKEEVERLREQVQNLE